MKRTRPIRGKYFLTIPRVAIHEPGVYEIKVKLSQVIVTKVKDIGKPYPEADESVHRAFKNKAAGYVIVGEIERGSVNGEESE